MSELKSTILASIAGAAVGAIATISTGAFGYMNKDRELDIEMVQVSLSILQGENTETSIPGRKFALRSLAKFTGIEIPDSEFEEWARTGTLPRIVTSDTTCDALAVKYADFVSEGTALTKGSDIKEIMDALGCLPNIDSQQR
ncbi:hypothetical protein JYP46_01850 [Nitratireductor aquimarinus]|uniref:hypothetical protein n=1 Tax=Alphaproteobacteria TaxID=28211 RepID=UPI0019D34968|nr:MULTISPECIES: hypothetical protein [Alphaproteobacteria]MBN7755554.1 hypothetical protein [Nitratireductor aquimarinus]MBY5998309.1 hypothetical protein [Tritonibacter mobilis]MBY6020340.1 hypothetical protein [Nitratireductor sp. DP7N14-4]